MSGTSAAESTARAAAKASAAVRHRLGRCLCAWPHRRPDHRVYRRRHAEGSAEGVRLGQGVGVGVGLGDRDDVGRRGRRARDPLHLYADGKLGQAGSMPPRRLITRPPIRRRSIPTLARSRSAWRTRRRPARSTRSSTWPQAGFWNNTQCHRVSNSGGLYMLQCGTTAKAIAEAVLGVSATLGTGGPGYAFGDENLNTGRRIRPGPSPWPIAARTPTEAISSWCSRTQACPPLHAVRDHYLGA